MTLHLAVTVDGLHILDTSTGELHPVPVSHDRHRARVTLRNAVHMRPTGDPLDMAVWDAEVVAPASARLTETTTRDVDGFKAGLECMATYGKYAAERFL